MNPYAGEIRMYAGTKIPENWAICNGDILPIHLYDVLFMTIGTTFGGDGYDNFALPDLRGRVPVHAGSGHDMTPIPFSQKGGSETIKVEAKYMSGHTHGVQAVNIAATSNDPKDLMMAISQTSTAYTEDVAKTNPDVPRPTPSPMHSVVVGPNKDAKSPNEVSLVQPYMAINFIIALQGLPQ